MFIQRYLNFILAQCFNLMRGGTSEAGSGRKSDSKSSSNRNSAAGGSNTQSIPADKKSSYQNLQSAIGFGEQLQFMTMPVSFL